MMRIMSNRGFVEVRFVIGFFVLLLIAIGTFGFSRAYSLILGPSVTISSLASENGRVTIKGSVARHTHFSINDRSVTPEQNGVFTEHLFVSSGHTIMSLYARDRFGREIEKKISLYTQHHGNQENNEESSGTEAEQG